MQIGARTVDRFPDGEVAVWVPESVRGKDIFLVQTAASPVNDHLVELLTRADACRRAAVARITAIVPYPDDAWADKRNGYREPITARGATDVLRTVGIAHVIMVDSHTPQIEGFFHIPVDCLTAVPTLCRKLRGRLPPDLLVAAQDLGRVRMAAPFAQSLDAPVIMLHKLRECPAQTKVILVSGDASNRACVIIDDMTSTGGTVAESNKALLGAGAGPEFIVADTHGLLLPDARDKLDHAAVREVLVCDTVPVVETDWQNDRVVSMAPLIADAMERTLAGDSIREMH
jgi:ribose-phosphate pyrophosphokinase